MQKAVEREVEGSGVFETVLDNAKTFNDCVNALATLIGEGEFDVTHDGLKLRAMDPTQIAMVDFFLPKSAFEKYELQSDTRIGLNLTDLARVTNRVRSGEKLTLRLDKTKSRLELVFRAKTTRKFNLPLLNVGGAVPKTPKIDFDSTIRINGLVLKESLKDAVLLSAHVVLKADAEGFTVTASGDKGDVIIEARKDEDILLEHTVNAPCRAMFPLEYLNDLLKNVEGEAVITLNLKTDAPLRLEYPIGQGTVVYYLAPRIETA